MTRSSLATHFDHDVLGHRSSTVGLHSSMRMVIRSQAIQVSQPSMHHSANERHYYGGGVLLKYQAAKGRHDAEAHPPARHGTQEPFHRRKFFHHCSEFALQRLVGNLCPVRF